MRGTARRQARNALQMSTAKHHGHHTTPMTTIVANLPNYGRGAAVNKRHNGRALLLFVLTLIVGIFMLPAQAMAAPSTGLAITTSVEDSSGNPITDDSTWFTYDITLSSGSYVKKNYTNQLVTVQIDENSAGSLPTNDTGVMRLKLKAGSTAYISAPSDRDLNYTIAEVSKDGYESKSSTNSSGTVSRSKQTAAEFTKTKTSASTEVQVTATKTLDGTEPGSKTFKFDLYKGTKDEWENGNATAIQTDVTNSPDGSITFDKFAAPTAAGTHTYVVAEQQDGQSGITYDPNKAYEVTVAVGGGSSSANADLTLIRSASKLEGDASTSSQGGLELIYAYDANGNKTTLTAYCIQEGVPAVGYYGYTENPSNEVLVNALVNDVTQFASSNKYKDNFEDTLRKLLYYFSDEGNTVVGNELSSVNNHVTQLNEAKKAYLIWCITGAKSSYKDEYIGSVDWILDLYDKGLTDPVPSNYTTVLFKGDGTGPNGKTYSSGQQQAMVAGYGGTSSSEAILSGKPTFANTTSSTPEPGETTGTLKVVKNLVDSSGSPITDDSTSFPFTVNLGTANAGKSVSVQIGSGAAVSQDVSDKGTITFNLTGGQTATISGVPAGSGYSVSESSTTGFSFSEPSNGTISDIAVSANGTSTATFTNKKNAAATGLTIGKTVVDSTNHAAVASDDTSFPITVNLQQLAYSWSSYPSNYTGDVTITYSDGTSETKSLASYDRGNLTIKLKHGQTAVLSGFSGTGTISYKVSESTSTMPGGYRFYKVTTSGSADAPTLSASGSFAPATGSALVTFENETIGQVGHLSITKALQDTYGKAYSDSSSEFSFGIALKNADGTPYANQSLEVNNPNGSDYTYSTNASGEVQYKTSGYWSTTYTGLKLKGAQTAVISNLPEGVTWTVTETNIPSSYGLGGIKVEDTTDKSTDMASKSASGSINYGVTAKTTFTNTYHPTYGITFKIKKFWSSQWEDPNYSPAIESEHPDVELEIYRKAKDGTMTLLETATLKGDGSQAYSVTFAKPTDGSEIVFKEKYDQKYLWRMRTYVQKVYGVQADGVSVDIQNGEFITHFNNLKDNETNYLYYYNTQEHTSFKVSKTVVDSSNKAVKSDGTSFPFTATLTYHGYNDEFYANEPVTVTIDGKAETVTTNDKGQVSFNLKHGQTAEIGDLPPMIHYAVAEGSLPTGYTLKSSTGASGDDCYTDTDEFQPAVPEAKFVNQRDTVVPTGIRLNNSSPILLGIAAAVAIAFGPARRRAEARHGNDSADV